jgi:phosphate transport system permease protein
VKTAQRPDPLLTGFGSGREGRRALGRVFRGATVVATLVGVVALLLLLAEVVVNGAGSLSGTFFLNFASRFPERAGIRAPLLGTLWLLALTAAVSVPVSVGAAVYLEEYAPRTRLTRLVQGNIANLAGVPSIVYGILGLALFVGILDLGRSVLAGALTLSLLIMPMIVLASQKALREVPAGVREAAYGLGATRWQVVRHQVLPLALPDIVAGSILALSRAIGEAAPLIMVGALSFIAFTPESLSDPFTALPVQIFNWVARPQEEFQHLAAAAIIVLLVLLLSMNVVAIFIRHRFGNRHGGKRLP